MKVWHKTWTLTDFIENLEEIKKVKAALMYYLFPFEDKIVIEYRAYAPLENMQHPVKYNTSLWKIRNHIWKKTEPFLGQWVEKHIQPHWLRYGIMNGFHKIIRGVICRFLKSDYTQAADQMIRYPDVSDKNRYTFSLWAFPENKYHEVLPAFFKFCKQYYKVHGYRTNLLNVGYRISQDANSLFSYSFDQNVMTVDPVSTSNPGWREFLVAYNEFCSNLGGTPMFNQTWGVTKQQAEKAFGTRFEKFKTMRKELDPTNRFLNHYFEGIF